MKNAAITEHHLYIKAFQKGERFVGRCVSVHILPDYTAKKRMLANPMKVYTNRIGLSVTKKIGCAVKRNRAKRIIRAGLHELEKGVSLKKGKLIVISARPDIEGRTSEDIRKELLRAFKKLDMIEGKVE